MNIVPTLSGYLVRYYKLSNWSPLNILSMIFSLLDSILLMTLLYVPYEWIRYITFSNLFLS